MRSLISNNKVTRFAMKKKKAFSSKSSIILATVRSVRSHFVDIGNENWIYEKCFTILQS